MNEVDGAMPVWYSNMEFELPNQIKGALMKSFKHFYILLLISLTVAGAAQPSSDKTPVTDTCKTKKGDLKITCIGHGTLMVTWQDKVIHIDPVSREADYTQLPKADLILITHEHGDHLDPKAVAMAKKDTTLIILTETCAKTLPGGLIMKNGDKKELMGLTIEAVPAYNLEKRFHVKGNGNGYIFTLADKRLYIAGDTENTPEMKALTNIDVAFLPMNLPYTMTPEQVADAALAFKPKILYPYHFGTTDPQKLVDLLKTHPEIEIRIRAMQ